MFDGLKTVIYLQVNLDAGNLAAQVKEQLELIDTFAKTLKNIKISSYFINTFDSYNADLMTDFFGKDDYVFALMYNKSKNCVELLNIGIYW